MTVPDGFFGQFSQTLIEEITTVYSVYSRKYEEGIFSISFYDTTINIIATSDTDNSKSHSPYIPHLQRCKIPQLSDRIRDTSKE